MARLLRKTPPRQGEEEAPSGAWLEVREKFKHFKALLEANNRVLKLMSDLEEKAQGEYLFDTAYIRSSLDCLRQGIGEIANDMVALGGEKYRALHTQYRLILDRIDRRVPGAAAIPLDDFIIPLSEVGAERALSVGSKSAQLGEMKTRLGLPVPEGFAVSTWAYRHFIESSGLQERIDRRLRSLNVKQQEDLQRASREIQELFAATPVPADLAQALEDALADLLRRIRQPRVSLRSSAVGEDAHLSFAGQYATFLNIQPQEMVARYRDVLAGKYTPQAIYYLLSQRAADADTAMGVCCLEMIDSAVSGVVYTHDPLAPSADWMLVSAIYGLGKYLVDGTLTPDLYKVSRSEGKLLTSTPARKPVRLVLKTEGGVVGQVVPLELQNRLSLDDATVERLAGYARQVEQHYCSPRDIEWAIDGEGRLVFLQCRPLRVMECRDTQVDIDLSGRRVLARGTTLCPGAGGGKIYQIRTGGDWEGVPDGAVLVAAHPMPSLVTTLGKVAALVAEVGGTASHIATLAREFRVPMVAGVTGAGELKAGMMVTVDATSGSVYEGYDEELIAARRREGGAFEHMAIYDLLRGLLGDITPLTMLDPSRPGFTAENCRTLHDITRFAHQKGMEEMCGSARLASLSGGAARRLKSDIPLQIEILFLDRRSSDAIGGKWVDERVLDGTPMQAFWGGVREVGWHYVLPSGRTGPLATGVADGERQDYSTLSQAIISREYMVLSLRMGYHLTTVETMCCDEPEKNYIRIQQKGGGATLQRRIWRVRLLGDILSSLGFENRSEGDFLDAILPYQSCPANCDRLRQVGRLMILTKQLDMALSNEAMMEWYAKDIRRQMGIEATSG